MLITATYLFLMAGEISLLLSLLHFTTYILYNSNRLYQYPIINPMYWTQAHVYATILPLHTTALAAVDRKGGNVRLPISHTS